jgi:hypothetical protein
MARPLTAHERAILLMLIEREPLERALRIQLENATYREPWFGESESFSLDVVVPDSERYFGENPLASSLNVFVDPIRRDDDAYVGSMVLWVNDEGLLSDFEYFTVTESMPNHLPPMDCLMHGEDSPTLKARGRRDA